MAALPYMQFYVADYLADTAHLNAAQHGAYMLLLMNYWQRGKALKNDNERLANVARMSNDEWTANKNIIAEFFQVTADEWIHKRIEIDLKAVAAKSAKAKAAGQASANNRKSNGRSTSAKQGVKRTFNHTDKIRTDKNRIDKKVSKGRGSRFALASPPGDWIQFCVTQRPDLDPGGTFDQFSDYWKARPGKEGMKLDWEATWRNWVRTQKSVDGVKNAKSTKFDLIAQGIEQARIKREQAAASETG